jgi:curved DNA-binding protein CbpA
MAEEPPKENVETPSDPKTDLYDVLGVARTASPEEIKAAYKKLALANHPDKNPGDDSAKERFQRVGAAYATLSDPKKRQTYDKTGEADAEEIDLDELLRSVVAEWTCDGGIVDEMMAAEGMGLDEDLIVGFAELHVKKSKGKLCCALCDFVIPAKGDGATVMEDHLLDEHRPSFESYAEAERRKMKESFESFLQASMGLSDGKDFVLPDGSKATMKPGQVPDLRGHFQNIIEKGEAGADPFGMDDEAAAMAEMREMLGGGDLGLLADMLPPGTLPWPQARCTCNTR